MEKGTSSLVPTSAVDTESTHDGMPMGVWDIFPKARSIAVLSLYSKKNQDKAFQMDFKLILDTLQRAISSLSAVYVFSSQATGGAGPESDLDLAILANTPPDAVGLCEYALRKPAWESTLALAELNTAAPLSMPPKVLLTEPAALRWRE